MVYPLGFAENSIQLVPDGTLLLHVLIILVMVYVLNATLFKPINRILEAREKRTRGRLTEAQEILGNVSEKLAEYERALRAARTEAYAFTEHERAGAMQDRQKQLGSNARPAECVNRLREGSDSASGRSSTHHPGSRCASHGRRNWLARTQPSPPMWNELN